MGFAWKDIAEDVGKIAPVLGTIVGGPAGTLVGGLISAALGCANDPQSVQQAIRNDPEAALKLQDMMNQHAEKMQALALQAEQTRLANEQAQIQADRDQVVAINTTMQTEAKAEHWLQWSWRPMNGHVLALGSAALVIGVLAMAWVAVINKQPDVLSAIPTVVDAVALALSLPAAVCGITAWHRGVAQRMQVANDSKAVAS